MENIEYDISWDARSSRRPSSKQDTQTVISDSVLSMQWSVYDVVCVVQWTLCVVSVLNILDTNLDKTIIIKNHIDSYLHFIYFHTFVNLNALLNFFKLQRYAVHLSVVSWWFSTPLPSSPPINTFSSREWCFQAPEEINISTESLMLSWWLITSCSSDFPVQLSINQ